MERMNVFIKSGNDPFSDMAKVMRFVSRHKENGPPFNPLFDGTGACFLISAKPT